MKKKIKEIILEAYQALVNEYSNPSFFLKRLINELLTNKRINYIFNNKINNKINYLTINYK